MEGMLLFALGLAGLVAVAWRPEWVAPYFTFLLYMRWSDALRTEFGVPPLFMLAAPGLLALVFGRWFFVGSPVGRAWRPALVLALVYGGVCLGSLLYAVEPDRTGEALMNQLDGLFILMVVVLALRTPVDFERTVSAILLAGLVLSGLSVYQQLTGSFDSSFAGFAHTELRNIYDDTSGARSEGPVSANYFALILVVIVPLATHRLLHGRSARERWVGGLAAVLSIVAIGFTYSRGGVVALAMACVPMFVWVPPARRRRVVIVAATCVGLAALAIAPTQFGQRLAALGQLATVDRQRGPEDSALRGRISEMVAAWQMFADHPILGIGYGNYETHYHRYARGIALDGRREERQAHSLYLEVAAETGLVGLAAFGVLIAYAMSSILRARAVLFQSGRDAEAQTATAFAIALFGYLAGSVFLHLSYPRYFWLLVGIAIAARGTVAAQRAPARVAERQPAFVGSGA